MENETKSLNTDINDDWLAEQLEKYSQPTTGLDTLNRIISILIWVFMIGMPTLLCILVGYKAALLVTGIFSSLMYINTMVSNLSNALVGRQLNGDFDLFWRIFFIMLSSISFTLFFAL